CIAVRISTGPDSDPLAAISDGSPASAPFGCKEIRNTTIRLPASARLAGGFQHDCRRALKASMSFCGIFAPCSAGSMPDAFGAIGEDIAESSQLPQICGGAGACSDCGSAGVGVGSGRGAGGVAAAADASFCGLFCALVLVAGGRSCA